MSNVIVNKEKIDILANAISAKSGEPVTMTLDEMVSAVDGIETGGGGITPTGNIDITSAGVTDVTNYATATVPSAEPDITYTNRGFYTENNTRKWHVRPLVDFPDGEGFGWMGSSVAGDFLECYAVASGTSVTPTESAQTIGGASMMMEGAVTVNAIPSNYVGSAITQRTSSDLSASGATVTAPSGYYESNATKTIANASYGIPTNSVAKANNKYTYTRQFNNFTSGYLPSLPDQSFSLTLEDKTATPTMSQQTITPTNDYCYLNSVTVDAMPSGTAGTPTATKGSVSNHSVTVTPSVTNTTGYITGSTINGTAVTITASELASGNKEITSNGTNIDVVGYSTVSVDVPTTGAVWQDQNGYVHLSDEGGGPTPPPTPTPTPWVRPSDWPDLSQMDVSSGDILYMTSYADEARGFCDFTCRCTGSYTVEVGSISGTTFTADATYTYASGISCALYYGSANGTYKVLKVTGTDITLLVFNTSNTKTIDNNNVYNRCQGIIDIVGKLPSCTSIYCYWLLNVINIDISNVILSNRISSISFTSCRSLVSLNTTDWDVSAVTSMNNWFTDCYSLTALDVSKWDVSSVTNMAYMFSGCSSLKALDVSKWDVSAVTSMDNMFSSCSSLTALDISDWDVSAVTSMTNMFSGCYSLTALDVSKWDVSSVTSMKYMFNNCVTLTALDISDWDVSAVTDISGIFISCYSLITLDVSKWDVSAATDMASMFSGCRSLTALDVSKWDVSAATSMNSMFSACYSLTTLDVSDWDVSSATNMSYMFYNCSTLTALDVSEWDVSAATNTSYMFGSCYSLTALDVSDWDISAATNMSYMFYNCSILTTLDVSDWDFSSITSESSTASTFQNCTSLYKSIILPSTFKYIGSSCFSGEQSIYEWHFKATTPPTLANSNAFSNMSTFNGKKIYVPYSADHSVLTAYQNATNWSSLAQYIVEEPAP